MHQISTFFKQSLLFFVLLISTTSARNVKFSVVSFGKSVKVKIGDSSYSLTKLNSYTPLFQSTIKVSDSEIS